MNGLTVVICCYNSTERLPITLDHLFKQTVTGICWEIILVDNASTDETATVALKLADKKNSIGVPLSIYREDRPGLSAARATGVAKAQYELILFCDDDNWLAPNYIELAYHIMHANPLIGALGGRGIPVSDVDLPFWFYSVGRDYATGVQNIESGDMSWRGEIWGAGMVIRKSILDLVGKYGFENILRDRTGNVLSSGGDVEICKWCLLAGYKLWYDESLEFKHYISPARLTKQYYRKLISGFNETMSSLYRYNTVLKTSEKPFGERLFLFVLFAGIGIMLSWIRKSERAFTFIVRAEAFNPFYFLCLEKETARIKALKAYLIRSRYYQPETAQASYEDQIHSN